MDYIRLIRNWLKTVSNEQFIGYKHILLFEIREEEKRRGIK